MRFKFKPNVNAPRGSSTANVGSSTGAAGVSGDGGEGGSGDGGEVRRKHRRLRSRGDESAGTEGESASELESGETSHPRRRRRKTSEGSSTGQRGGEERGQHQSSVKESTTSKTTSSLSTKESDSTRTESIQKTSSTVEDLHTAIASSTQGSKSFAPQVETRSSEGAITRGQTATSEKATEEVQAVHSSAGQVESSADSKLHTSTLAMLLTRGNAVAAASGRTVPKIKKKVAPKVILSRPKRTPRPTAAGTEETASEFSQPSSQQQQEEAEIGTSKSTENTSLVEKGKKSQSRSQDVSSSQHRTHTSSECSCSTGRTQPNSTSNSSNEAHSEPSTESASGNLTSDEAIPSTLNEVLSSAQSQEQTNHGLDQESLRGFTASGDDMRVPGDGDTIVVMSEEGGQNEIEVRTNEKSTADSDESFIVQGCTDAVERTTSESPRSVTDKTGQTSVSSSLSSSQEPQQASFKSTSRRRGGSAGPRSRRSVSRASSICSEVSGEGEKETTGTPTKGKRRQKRKKASADSTPSPDEPSSLGASPSPSPKKHRTSTVKVREAPDRSTMTMQELIYYNPSANPMSSSVEEKKRKKEEGQSVSGQGSRASSVQPSAGSRATSPANQDGGGGEVGGASNLDDDNSGGGRIVPTLRIGVDGKIVIDESSMVMETTQQEPLEDGGEIVMDSIGHTTSASYRRRCKVTRWTKEETNRFFKALRQVGTDFTMMTLLIPKRSRRELKNKFKKEERNNPHLVSQALSKI